MYTLGNKSKVLIGSAVAIGVLGYVGSSQILINKVNDNRITKLEKKVSTTPIVVTATPTATPSATPALKRSYYLAPTASKKAVVK